jgi:hypothetical protein
VYSQTPEFEFAIAHGINGFLAGKTEEWEKYLCQLIESPNLRSRMGQAAQDNLLKNWMLRDHINEWEEAYHSVLERNPTDRDKLMNPWLGIARQSARNYEDVERQLIVEKNRALTTKRQLDEILGSRSWRWLKRIQHLRWKLIPNAQKTRNPELFFKDDRSS